MPRAGSDRPRAGQLTDSLTHRAGHIVLYYCLMRLICEIHHWYLRIFVSSYWYLRIFVLVSSARILMFIFVSSIYSFANESLHMRPALVCVQLLGGRFLVKGGATKGEGFGSLRYNAGVLSKNGGHHVNLR